MRNFPVHPLTCFMITLFLVACSSENHEDYSGTPVWGPISQGACLEAEASRRYTATLYGGTSDDACEGPFKNVMGAHFSEPSTCDGSTGIWHVKDLSCSAEMPSLPGIGPDDAPLETAEGFADLHNHLLAHVAFGEAILWGSSYGEPEDALTPIPEALRRPHQRVEALNNAQSILDVYEKHDEDGHPTYNAWPVANVKTHQQSHVDWLHRAYQGGLRLVVVNTVNNQDIFGRGETRMANWLKPIFRAVVGSGGVPVDHRTSNDMEALEHQVRAAHELVDWVAQHRGGWLEIAETPEEASELIASGKMALVLGSEVDHPLNCDLDRRCSEAHIQEGLTKLEALGLAVIFPTHHKETQFGDAANFTPINSGPTRPCPEFTQDCAAVGLAPKGEFLIREMMARGMLADLGHAGDKPFEDTMRLFEAENYPTIMTHASAHPLRPSGSAEYTLTYEQLRRIDAVSGMISLHSAEGEYPGQDNRGAPVPFSCTNGGEGYAQSYLYSRDALEGAYMDNDDRSRGGQVTFAPDWNGFAGWPTGRFGPEACERKLLEATGEPLVQPDELTYPLALPSNLLPAAVGGVTELPIMQFEGRTFDFNVDGLAQVGLQPDLLADMRLYGLSEADLDPLYRSARGFVDMWQRARDAQVANDRGSLRWLPPSPTDLIDFDYLDTSRLVELRPGVPLCRISKSGQVGSLVSGTCQLVEGSAIAEPDEIVGEIRNANSGMCLTARYGFVDQMVCNDSVAQTWRLTFVNSDGGSLHITSLADDRCVTSRGRRIRVADCARTAPIELERIGNTYRLRAPGGQCIQVWNRSLKSKAGVITAECPPAGRADFHWEIDALRQVEDVDRLFSTRALEGSVEWQNVENVSLPYAVTARSGAELCRAEERLGVVNNNACRLDETTSVSVYEALRSDTRLRHD